MTTSNLVGLIGGALTLFFLIALPSPWNARLPFYLLVFVWTLLRPRVALYLLPFAVPWGSLDIINVVSLNMNSADVLVAFLAIGWLSSFALSRRATTMPASIKGKVTAGPCDRESSHIPRYLLFAVLALIGTMILSMSVATSISSSLKEVSKWVEFFVLVLLGAQYVRTRRQLWTIIVLVCLAGITQAFFGYIQAFFNLGPEVFIRDTSLRVYGTFEQPNPYAGYINIPLSLAAALMLLGSNRATRILAGVAAVLLAGAVYLSQSRGGELAIAVALVFIVTVGMPHLRKVFGLLLIAGLGVSEFFFTGWIPTYIFTPVLKVLGAAQVSFTTPSTQDFSTAERLAHWIAGLRMFLDHPLIGVGIGNYPDVYSRYFVTIFVNSLGHAHNYYINIAAETGSIGLTAFLLFLLAMFVAGGSSYQSVSKKCKQAKDQQLSESKAQAGNYGGLIGTNERFSLLLHPFRMAEYYRTQGSKRSVLLLTNDRALAIGLLAALISVCTHNLVDDLYVHSVTDLIALLLVALIRLEGVTVNVERPPANGG